MYGVIFDFLREYVIERHGGRETWESLLKAQGYGYKIYIPVNEYPDSEIVALAKTAANALNTPLPDVLEDFGSFVGHKLVTFYHMYVTNPNWKAFEIIENAGIGIHDAIHRHNQNRQPPMVTGERLSENELNVHYSSKRKMCPVVRGIVRGLSDHYGESFKITETQCMHKGAAECIINVKRLP